MTLVTVRTSEREIEGVENLGPYRICSFLRAGGMGEIYRGVDERLQRAVALKLLPPQHAGDARRRRRLLDEARLLSTIRHPHVCQLYDVGHCRGVDFLVLELLEGRTLAERLAAGPLELSEVLRIGSQIARALHAAHRAGIAHRDLTPKNIMLSVRGGHRDPWIKLLDFGLAREIDRAAADSDGDASERTTKASPSDIEGTWAYMAPERFGEVDVDAGTDVWSLGVVLYEMVCGVRPFAGRSAAALVAAILRSSPRPPSAIVAGCSGELSRAIERCLEKDCSRRWSSCAELAEQLDRLAIAERRNDGTCARKRRRSPVERIGTAAAWSALLVCACSEPESAVPLFDGVALAAPPVSKQTITAAVLPAAAPMHRLDRSQMEEFLGSGRIEDLERLSIGVTGSSRAVVTWQGLAHRAHVQTIDSHRVRGSQVRNLSDCYSYNVAAYRLDKLLDLNMVPVSVKRTVRGAPAAVTWWIDDVEMMELERRRSRREPPDVRSWNVQMYRALVFQELIANSDFNQTNILITRDWEIWLIDFTRAFRGHRKLMNPARLKSVDQRLWDALESLDEESLGAEMNGLLSRSQVRGIIGRRDLILQVLARSQPSA